MSADIIRFPIERRVRVAPRERPFFEQFEGLPDMAQIERWAKAQGVLHGSYDLPSDSEPEGAA